MSPERSIRIGRNRYLVESDDEYLTRMGPEFEPHTIALLNAFVDSSSVVADVGANIGLTTLFLAEKARKVVAFEPSPSTFEILERNVRRSGASNIELVNCGLGNRHEQSTITFSKRDRSGGFVSNLVRPEAGHVTETIDIDRLDDRWSSQGENLHLVKLDVEGFEQEVLEGASETIRVHRPTVILELNHWCLNAFRRRTVPDFFDFLRETFPVLRALDHDNRNPRDLHDNDQSYEVMHEHIVKFRYPTIVAGFDRAVAETAAKAPQSV